MADTTRGIRIGMNFADFVESGDERNVKIGAKDGSAFFYCGSLTKLKYSLDIIDDNLQNWYLQRVEETKAKLQRALNREWSPAVYASCRYRRSGTVGTYEEYLKAVQAYFAELEKIRREHQTAKEKCENREPLYLREVYEFYESIDEPGTLIVIITGDETGKYWTTHEYKKGAGNGHWEDFESLSEV